MTWVVRVVVLGWIAILMGCETGSIYKPFSQGVGYQESFLTTDRVRIQVSGGTQTSWERVQDALLLRAAELADAKNQGGFRIVTVDSQRERTLFRLQDNQPHNHFYGSHGARGTVSGAYSPNAEHRPVDRIVSIAVVEFLPDYPQDNSDPDIYDVAAVISDLRPVLVIGATQTQ